MLTSALVAAFLSGFAWSALDIARKSLSRDVKPSIIAAGLTLGMAVLFGVWAAISGATVQVESYVPPAAVSIVLAGAIQLLILESMRRSELSRTIPLLSFTPVATMVSGAVVLGEMPSKTQWVGIVLVFAGALHLGLSRAEGARRSRLPFDTGGWLMLGAALLISAAAPFDKLAVAASSVEVHAFLQAAGVGVLLVLFLGVRGELADVGRAFVTRPALLWATIFVSLAIGLQFAAYRGTMVGVVETVKRVVGLACALVAGRSIFGEPITSRKLTAVTVMGIGVTLMLV